MNLQEALAENLKAVMNDSDPDQELNYTPVTDQETSPVSIRSIHSPIGASRKKHNSRTGKENNPCVHPLIHSPTGAKQSSTIDSH